MAKLNFLAYLNAYSDQHSTNNPSKNNFKWERDLRSLSVDNPTSLEFSLAPGETKTLFNGTRTLAQDGTTQYSIALAPSETTKYRLTWVAGTAPAFRVARTSGADATTQITVTQNGPVTTYSSTGGTALNLIVGGVVVGDYVRIGSLFNDLNQGEWQIISRTATSFSVVNALGAAEGPITLTSDFANQINIYGAAGVQVGDTLVISGGFSPVTQGSYVVTAVSAQWVEFSSVAVLPTEGPILTQAIAVYSAAQRLVYLEADKHVSMSLNGVSGNEIDPLVDCTGRVRPGVFLRMSTVYSMSVTNTSEQTASLFFAAVE